MKFQLEELPEKVTRLSRRAVSTELAKIAGESEEGLVTAQSVVDTARHPDNPMHKHFIWDDEKASESYRLMQARQLIRWVKVTSPNNGKTSVQKYVSLMADRKREGGGYRETAKVVNNKKLRAELEDTAKTELASWVRRHAVLTELCERVKAAAGI